MHPKGSIVMPCGTKKVDSFTSIKRANDDKQEDNEEGATKMWQYVSYPVH